jgi:hypothetical protein
MKIINKLEIREYKEANVNNQRILKRRPVIFFW